MKRGLFIFLFLIFIFVFSYTRPTISQSPDCSLASSLGVALSSEIPKTIPVSFKFGSVNLKVVPNGIDLYSEPTDPASGNHLPPLTYRGVFNDKYQSQSCKYYQFAYNGEYYGVTYEVDSCGNVLAQPDSNGDAFSFSQVADSGGRAQTFVDACKARNSQTSPTPTKNTNTKNQRQISSGAIALTYNGVNGMLDKSGNDYYFCGTTDDTYQSQSPCTTITSTSPYVPHFNKDDFTLLDTTVPITGIRNAQTTVTRVESCKDMNIESARDLVQFNINSDEAKFITLNFYLPHVGLENKAWTILDGSLKVFSPNAGQGIQIFSYNPLIQELVIAPADITQTSMHGSVVLLIQKPEGTPSKDTFHASWANPVQADDGTLDYRYAPVLDDTTGWNMCTCWKGSSPVNEYDSSHLDGVRTSVNEYVSSGGKCS